MVFIGELARLTSDQLTGGSPTLLVPVGSTEQHGPHLPLDTDTRIAVAVATEAAARLSTGSAAPDTERRWPVAPAIGYGASGEHQSFAGTISIGTETLDRVLLEYGRSASAWARRLVFVNGHGGNLAALRSAVGRLRFEGRDAGWTPCAVATGDAHAGHTETSLLLHLSPADVRTERCRPGNRTPLAELLPAIRRGGVAAVSAVGILGDPTAACASDGERIFGEMVDRCVRAIRDWAPSDDGLLR